MNGNRLLTIVLVMIIATALLPQFPTQVQAQTPQSNLLTNSGFESGNILPTGWLPDAFAGGVEFVWDDTHAKQGFHSLMIAASQPNDARWLQAAAVRPHTDYRLSGWIRTSNVAHADGPVEAGANLTVYETWEHTPGIFGTHTWTYVSLTFNSGDRNRVIVGGRLGYWSGTATGAAWFDEVRLEAIDPPAALGSQLTLPLLTRNFCAGVTLAPSWKILVNVYRNTDFHYYDANNQERHFTASLSQSENDKIVYTVNRFVNEDIPALNGCAMRPTVEVRFLNRPLSSLTPLGCNDYVPAPDNVSDDRDPAFDAVISIFDGSGIDQLSGQPWSIQGCAWAWGMGTGQTYDAIPADMIGYNNRNVLKHEWGHSILFYYEAAGASPLPAVDNHMNDTDNRYVTCRSSRAYIFEDETDWNLIPHAIYNNLFSFTHDYYSGQTATPDQPNRCLGIPPAAWATGGPVTQPAQPDLRRPQPRWRSPADDVITTAVPD